MRRHLRLHPAAWRERYEAEFVGTLHDRPLGLATTMNRQRTNRRR